MGSRSRHLGAAILCLAGLLAPAVADDAAERALWSLWTLHQRETTNGNHQAVIAACEQWTRAQANNPFLPVCRGLAGWHLLKAGATGDAVKVFTTLAQPGPEGGVSGAARTVALRWLTRTDREQVGVALRDFYVHNVRYPDSIDELQKAKGTPAFASTDRWGKPWRYKLAKFKRLAKMRDQRYELESATLAGSSDLRQALAAPYAGSIALVPVEVTKGGNDGRPAVVFESHGQASKKAVLTEGTDYEGVTLVYAGVTLIVLSDGDYWQVLQKPGN
jgi:hypothetical protein